MPPKTRMTLSAVLHRRILMNGEAEKFKYNPECNAFGAFGFFWHYSYGLMITIFTMHLFTGSTLTNAYCTYHYQKDNMVKLGSFLSPICTPVTKIIFNSDDFVKPNITNDMCLRGLYNLYF